MRIPRFWAKGEFDGVDKYGDPLKFTAWGWSDDSDLDAQQRGADRARQAFLSYNRSKGNRPAEEYAAYLDVPLKEEVIESLQWGGNEAAIITRNHYGALVLNTANVLFVDVDLPRSGHRRSFRSFFSAKRRGEELRQLHNQVVERILAWSNAHPEYGFRLYQTCAGYRLLFTSDFFDPRSDEVESIFDGLGADGLYRLLTRKQESFRARLTPKPWRIKMKDCKYPFLTDDAAVRLRRNDWVREYDSKSAGYQTCMFVDSFGPTGIAREEISQVAIFHDQHTIRGQSLPLA